MTGGGAGVVCKRAIARPRARNYDRQKYGTTDGTVSVGHTI